MTFEETIFEVIEKTYDPMKQCWIVCWKDNDGKENWDAIENISEAVTLQKILVTDYGYRPVTIAAVFESTDHMIHPKFDNRKEN